ncbi:efflux transporter outer membrane subunit [Ramlibacter sp.]|uniref:efflux transporter outer membrane subunit n=1 Tax=Ramlibacter sp. TaxID=1917967 RepID=UPI003D0A25B9
MTRLRSLAAICAAVLLSACAAVPRPPATPTATLPPQWHAPLPHDGKLADLTVWWQQFNDPLLIDLIDAAQTAAPTVAAAVSRIDQARAARVIAASALLPTVDASASASRGRQPPSPAATTIQGGAQTAWEYDLFGGKRATIDAAAARLRGAQAGWHDARVSVAAETGNAYLAYRTCERQLGVATRDAQSRAETSRLTRLSTDAGFTAPATAALARASAAEASARATQQRAQCDIDVKALVALSGLPEPRLRERLEARWTEPAQFAMLALAPIPAQLLAQRPDVYQAELDVAAASAEVGSARADQYPRLTLSGSLAIGKARVGGETLTLDTWSIGPVAVTLPIFDGGRRAAAVEAAQARYGEAAAVYAARVRQAVREVEVALVDLDSARARSEDAVIAVEGYRASFVATEARYRSGLASLIELEDQRRVMLAAETALVALQRERVAAWIALYRAVGGGWVRPRQG